jgi:hypothetical protein
VDFKIVGEIGDVETFAIGSSIREVERLRRIYGRGRWRKRKGVARVALTGGVIRLAELHGTKPPASGAGSSRSNAI